MISWICIDCSKKRGYSHDEDESTERIRRIYLEEKKDVEFQLKYYKGLVDDLLAKNYKLQRDNTNNEELIKKIKSDAFIDKLDKEDKAARDLKEKYNDVPPAMVALGSTGVTPPRQPFAKD